MNETKFNLENVYDDEIAPLMKKIIDVCLRVNMPMVASFAYATGSTCTTALVTSERTPERFVAAQKKIMEPVTFWMASHLQENGQ